MSEEVNILKYDEDKRLVFGWASVSLAKDGLLIVDADDEVIPPEELEAAAYDYVLTCRMAGEGHIGGSIGDIVESFMLTPDKAKAMGISEPGITGWWIGVKVHDPEIFKKVKEGDYQMFSIQGVALKEQVV